MTEAEPRITPPGPLPPPIIGTDPASAPGQEQPVIVAGGQSLPPSLPAGTTFTSPGWGWLPPPQVGMGENEPFPTAPVNPAEVPPSVAGYEQPQFATGSATSPTAAQLFPQFTTNPPMQPIVLNATQAASTGVVFPDDWVAPPFPIPTTPGVQPITLDDWGLGAGPGGGGQDAIFPFIAAENGDPFEPMKHLTENTFDPGSDAPPPPKRRAAPKKKKRR